MVFLTIFLGELFHKPEMWDHFGIGFSQSTPIFGGVALFVVGANFAKDACNYIIIYISDILICRRNYHGKNVYLVSCPYIVFIQHLTARSGGFQKPPLLFSPVRIASHQSGTSLDLAALVDEIFRLRVVGHVGLFSSNGNTQRKRSFERNFCCCCMSIMLYIYWYIYI